MSKKRLVGEHFRRDGRAKRGFATREEAIKEKVRAGKAHAYKCGFPGCGLWHVGGSR